MLSTRTVFFLVVVMVLSGASGCTTTVKDLVDEVHTATSALDRVTDEIAALASGPTGGIRDGAYWERVKERADRFQELLDAAEPCLEEVDVCIEHCHAALSSGELTRDERDLVYRLNLRCIAALTHVGVVRIKVQRFSYVKSPTRAPRVGGTIPRNRRRHPTPSPRAYACRRRASFFSALEYTLGITSNFSFIWPISTHRSQRAGIRRVQRPRSLVSLSPLAFSGRSWCISSTVRNQRQRRSRHRRKNRHPNRR